MALGEPLPKKIFGHGWLLIDSAKMSKSRGNVIDPFLLTDKYGVDAVRYFLLREVVFGGDGNYTHEAFLTRTNSDLANDLGNLLSRTVGMIDKYFGGSFALSQIPAGDRLGIADLIKQTVSAVEIHMDKMFFSDALTQIWNLVRRMNKFADETAPWTLAKDESKKEELAEVLYTLAEALRVIAVLISPFMPKTPGIIRAQLNMEAPELATWESAKTFGLAPARISITKGPITFPRMDIKKELAEWADSGSVGA
jgi:methionyl-tRNA synthetase